ncbi:unnamed protein product [Rhodiola kirilowii]
MWIWALFAIKLLFGLSFGCTHATVAVLSHMHHYKAVPCFWQLIDKVPIHWLRMHC